MRKGWIVPLAPGKDRKRAVGFQPDDRHEDINQPSPRESAEDRDDERQHAAGLDAKDKEDEASGRNSPKQSDAD